MDKEETKMPELLPLGSVVTLREGNKKIMIVGRLQKHMETEEICDYAAVLWPEGLIDSKRFYLFNQDDIQCLYFVGLQDVEEFNYRYELEDQYNQLSHP